MARRLVVSDIHGEADRLRSVLAQARYSPDKDRLFLLGDYIDRGIDAKGTLELVKRLVADGAVALMGNHEQMMLRALNDELDFYLWLYNGGLATMKSFGGQLIPEWASDFLAGLPLYHEEPDYILVHAGLKPGVPLKEQSSRDMLWIRDDFINDHQGEYEGKTVVFGHTPVTFMHDTWEPWFGKNKIGIDTGSVFGGCLTLLDLNTHKKWTA